MPYSMGKSGKMNEMLKIDFAMFKGLRRKSHSKHVVIERYASRVFAFNEVKHSFSISQQL